MTDPWSGTQNHPQIGSDKRNPYISLQQFQNSKPGFWIPDPSLLLSNSDLYFLIKILFPTSWVAWHNSIEYHDAASYHIANGPGHLFIYFLFLPFQKWDSSTKISILKITLSKLYDEAPEPKYHMIKS